MNHIKEFKKHLNRGMADIKTACDIYVLAIDSEKDAKKSFASSCPEIPPAAWANFEMIGRGAMDHRLLWGGGRANGALKKLPKSEQTKILDNGIEMPAGDSKRVVPVENLNGKDIKMVFKGHSIRTVDEQRAYSNRELDRAERPAYYIDGSDLVVTRYVRIPLTTIRKLAK